MYYHSKNKPRNMLSSCARLCTSGHVGFRYDQIKKKERLGPLYWESKIIYKVLQGMMALKSLTSSLK